MARKTFILMAVLLLLRWEAMLLPRDGDALGCCLRSIHRTCLCIDQTRDYFTASHWNRYTTYTQTSYEGVNVFNEIVLTRIDLNIALRRRIDIVTKQAHNNYDSRK